MEAELGFGCDREDVDVEALVGKLSVMVVGQQGVVDGSNPFLFAAILPPNLAKAEEEEGCKEQRQMGDISKSPEH